MPNAIVIGGTFGKQFAFLGVNVEIFLFGGSGVRVCCGKEFCGLFIEGVQSL